MKFSRSDLDDVGEGRRQFSYTLTVHFQHLKMEMKATDDFICIDGAKSPMDIQILAEMRFPSSALLKQLQQEQLNGGGRASRGKSVGDIPLLVQFVVANA